MNKKVLLHERKRHTACRMAIAISCYSGGGPLTKNFFFQSEHVSSQIWCQKFFPLLRPGPPLPPIQGWMSLPENLIPGIPLPPVQGWISLPKNLRLGTPPPPCPRLDQPTRKSVTWDPPQKCEQTETITFPHPSDGGW